MEVTGHLGLGGGGSFSLSPYLGEKLLKCCKQDTEYLGTCSSFLEKRVFELFGAGKILRGF